MNTGLRETKKLLTKQIIAQTAITLFVERGFEPVSIVDIANAAAVSKMTVFNYFPAKEEMFFYFADRFFPDFTTVLTADASLPETITALHTYLRNEFKQKREWTGLHEGGESYGRLLHESSTLRSALDRRWSQQIEQLSDALLQSKECNTSVTSGLLATTLLRGLQYIVEQTVTQRAEEMKVHTVSHHALDALDTLFELIEHGIPTAD